MNDLANSCLAFSRKRMIDDYWPRLRTCAQSLSDEQIWWRPNDVSNSVGNLLSHLDGNLNQWIVAAFEHRADTRDRPAEFRARSGPSREALLDRLGVTMQHVGDILGRLTEADLQATYHIQGYTVNGLSAVYQVTEHFALHYGQVAYITKSLVGRNLDFTPELDKTGRLEPSDDEKGKR